MRSLRLLLLVLLSAVHALLPVPGADAAEAALCHTCVYDSQVVSRAQVPAPLLTELAVPQTAGGGDGMALRAISADRAATTQSVLSSTPRAAGVDLVNGRRPINSSYAGKMYNGAGWTDDLMAKYPNGVRFNDAGFPDFSPY